MLLEDTWTPGGNPHVYRKLPRPIQGSNMGPSCSEAMALTTYYYYDLFIFSNLFTQSLKHSTWLPAFHLASKSDLINTSCVPKCSLLEEFSTSWHTQACRGPCKEPPMILKHYRKLKQKVCWHSATWRHFMCLFGEIKPTTFCTSLMT